MACCSRTSFNETVEVVQIDHEVGKASSSSCQSVEPAAPCAAKRESPPAPVRTTTMVSGTHASEAFVMRAPIIRLESWASSSTLPEADCSYASASTALGDSDLEEVAEENVFEKAAQRRRIRRSVTANYGPGLPTDALPTMETSRILTRRSGSVFRAASSGSADDSNRPAESGPVGDGLSPSAQGHP